MGHSTTQSEANVEPSEICCASKKADSLALKATLVAASSSALSACGGGSSKAPAQSALPVQPTPTPSPTATSQSQLASQKRAAARDVLHASLSAARQDIDAIIDRGFENWLDREIARSNDSTAQLFFETRGFDRIDDNRYWRKDRPFDNMIWSELLKGGSGVRKRMALALSEIFVVSINELDIPWPSQAVGAYWDMLNRHAFGNFRDLIEDVTLSPAMGVFLDTRGNQKADPTTGRVADENFARELLQLFTIGLVELNRDGSLKRNSGQPIETFGNSDVEGLAKVLTGYNLDYKGVDLKSDPRGSSRPVPTVQLVRQNMTSDHTRWIDPSLGNQHSTDVKQFLGLQIPQGTDANRSLKLALDHIFNHPNVAPFFSKQLIQRLVTSNPSSAYIERVARIFEDNGVGQRGDLRAVFKAVVLDPDARSVEGLSDPFFGKLREPIIRFAQWGRSFGATSKSDYWNIRNISPPEILNQVPFRAPSVFNFFRPGYEPPRSQASANGLVAPEFQIVDETTVASYAVFLRASIEGTGYWTDDIVAQYQYELSIADQSSELIDHLDLVLSGGQLRASTKSQIQNAVDSMSSDVSSGDKGKLYRVMVGVMLTMASNDYLIQK